MSARTEERRDRDLVPVTTVAVVRRDALEVTRFVNDFYRKLAQADKREEEREFELRVFGELFPPTTRERLFGKESK